MPEEKSIGIYITVALAGIAILFFLYWSFLINRGERIQRAQKERALEEERHKPPEEVVERLTAPIPDPSLEEIPKAVIEDLKPQKQPQLKTELTLEPPPGVLEFLK